MANNTTNVWKWDGRTSSEWQATNWTDGSDVQVDDYPDSAADTVTMSSSAVSAMTQCAGATEVGSITQGASYSGACCVANITVGTVTVNETGGTVTGGVITTLNSESNAIISGGTITTLNAGGTSVISGGDITTANLSGSASATGGSIVTANVTGSAVIAGASVTTLNWNSSGAQIYGTFSPTIRAYKAMTIGGGNTSFNAAGVTTIYVMRRELAVTLNLDGVAFTGNATFNYSQAYGHGSPMSLAL